MPFHLKATITNPVEDWDKVPIPIFVNVWKKLLDEELPKEEDEPSFPNHH